MLIFNPDQQTNSGERQPITLSVEDQIELEAFKGMVQMTIQQVVDCIVTGDDRIIVTQISEEGGSEKDPLINGAQDREVSAIFHGVINQEVNYRVLDANFRSGTQLLVPTIIPGLLHVRYFDRSKSADSMGFQYSPQKYHDVIRLAVAQGLMNQHQADNYLRKLRF